MQLEPDAQLGPYRIVAPLDAGGMGKVEFIAAAYASIGEMDRAFEWLNRAFETRSFLWSWLSQGHEWEPLRHDPRRAALTKRAGLG